MIDLISHSKPYLREKELQVLNEVIESGYLADANKTDEFRYLIKNYIGIKDLTFTSSGTHALSAIFEIINLKKGDEVILPSYVCESVMIEILKRDAVPIFCEIDNWVSNENLITEKVNSKTKAIIIVHLFGIECTFERLKDLGIPIIEDCCQSFGLKINNQTTGSIGDFSFFSFHPTKCLTTGEGGAFCVNNEKYNDEKKLFLKMNHFTFKMSNLNSSIGCSQLLDYDDFLIKRKNIANRYIDILKKHNINNEIKNSIWFRFPLLVSDSNLFIEFFNERSITVRKGVDKLLHKKYNFKVELNRTEYVFDHTISLPIYPALKFEEINLICKILNQYISTYGL